MRYRHFALLLPVLLIISISCQPGRDIAGKYKAADPHGGREILQLELKSDGKGSWKMGLEEVSLTWEEQGTEVWLHLKVGGVIPGSIGKDGSISISLPESGNLRFQRTP
jgi:hypothetical protein